MIDRTPIHRRPRPARHRAGRSPRPGSWALAVLTVGLLALVAGSLPAGAARPAARPAPPTVLWGISPSGADPTQPSTRSTFSYALAKGGTVSDKVTIWNEGNQPLPLRIYSTDALDTAEGQFGIIPENQAPSGVGTWVSLLERNVIVPPHSGHVTGLTVHVPADADPGDHAGALVAVLQTPQSDPSGHQVLVQQQVASPIYVRVAGRLVPQLSVSVSSHYHRGLLALGGGSLEADYTVRNVGNVRLAARQQITVAAPFGITLKTVHLPDLPELLPGAQVTRKVHVEDVLPLLRLTTTVHLAPYSTDSTGLKQVPSARGSSSVWAIPWLWLLIAAAVIGYLWWRRSRRRQPGTTRPAPAAPSPPEGADVVAATADGGTVE